MEKGKCTEAQIVKAATGVFLEKGYAGVNMSMIAEAAGIARPALYYYFRTKDKIFNEIIGSLFKSFSPSVMGVLHSDAPMDKRIDALVEVYFDQFLSLPGLPLFLIREINRDPDFVMKVASEMKVTDHIRSLVEFLQKEIGKGNIKPQPPCAIMYTFLGQLMIPFLSKPVAERIFAGDSPGAAIPDFESIVRKWQPYVAQSLKSLLLP